jgi:hypothetical protein
MIQRIRFATERIRDHCCIVADHSAHALNVTPEICRSIQSDINEKME